MKIKFKGFPICFYSDLIKTLLIEISFLISFKNVCNKSTVMQAQYCISNSTCG